MLDEIYLVIPSYKHEHIKSSYRRYLKKIGAGLAILNGNDLSIVFPSSKFHCSMIPDLKKSEAWLKQMLWNYFEKKFKTEFEVEGEGILPKPMTELKKIQLSKASNSNRFLQTIDLFLLPKDHSIMEVAVWLYARQEVQER